MPNPPRKVSWAAAACLVLGYPLAELAWLWLWGNLVLLCWSPWWALKYLAGGFLAMGLLPFWACLREGLRLLWVLRQGQGQHFWLRECLEHPARKWVWLGSFESAKGQLLRLPLSHSHWQPGQIYLILHDPAFPDESVAWDDLPVKLRVPIQGRICLARPWSGLIPLAYLVVALAAGILVWWQIAR